MESLIRTLDKVYHILQLRVVRIDFLINKRKKISFPQLCQKNSLFPQLSPSTLFSYCIIVSKLAILQEKLDLIAYILVSAFQIA